MEKDNQENSKQYVSGDFMVKRKRGRPRKHMGMDSNEQSRSTPARYERGSRDQPCQRDNDMVGQPVSGVIEAVFEAGYLLSVKLGNNSESVLRGVVFKPGRCVPVSADNDVAPNVPMIHRNTFSFSHSKKSANKETPKNLFHPVGLEPDNTQNGGRQVDGNHGSQRVPSVMQSGSAGHDKPFESLLTAVMNSNHGEPETDEQVLSIEPLQAIHPVHHVHMPKPLPGYGGGKMTELLKAVQENVRDNHVSQ